MIEMLEMKKLIKELNEATAFYDAGDPRMTDAEWDEKYFELVALEKDYGFIYPDSPTQKISYNIVNQLNKITHSHPMLSLAKTKSLDDVWKFVKDNAYVAMDKMDGLTCSLYYENGCLVSAETRGNGAIGEDVSHNAKVISSIPQHIPYQEPLTVDGEIICRINDFQEFENEYKNPRNFAAGSIRLLDANECAQRNLTFIAWDAITPIAETLHEKLQKLEAFGFSVVPYILCEKNNNDSAIVQKLIDLSQNNKYPIDGIVFKIDDCETYESLGRTSHHFNGGLAYKFFDDSYPTHLRDIEWTMGRSGVLTPVAIFDEIEIDGSIIGRASLHNYSIMVETLGRPYVGQEVYVYKANQIIPQISSAVPAPQDKEVEFINLPTSCPACGGAVRLDKTNGGTSNLICENPQCGDKLINSLDHFFGKKGLDVRGLSIATFKYLINWGYIQSAKDVFDLKKYRDDWAQKAGFGPRSVDKILTAIEESKNNPLDKFITALGIPLVGSTISKEICAHEKDWQSFRADIDNHFDFTSWDTFGLALAEELYKFDYSEADYIVANYMNLTNPCAITASKELEGLKIAITGSLQAYKNRSALQADIEAHGGKVVSSVSKNTNYLINNDNTSSSAKNLQAQKLGVPILTESEFITKFLTF